LGFDNLLVEKSAWL